MNSEQRIAELEAKLTLAEDLLEALNVTVFRQQERIDLMSEQMARLAQQLRALTPAEARRSEQEVPPHY